MAGTVIRTAAGLPRFNYDPSARPATISALLTPGEISGGTFEWSGSIPTSGLVARWEGDTSVAAGGNGDVSTWTDSVGDRVLTRDSESEPPLVGSSPGGTASVVVGNGGMRLTGGITGLPSGAGARTALLCFRPTGGFYGGIGWGIEATARSFMLGINDAPNGLDYIVDWYGGRLTGSASTGEWVVLIATYNGTTIELFENGVSAGTVVQALDTGAEGVNLGLPWGSLPTTPGSYGMAAIWSRVLDAGERTQVLNYCNGRWVNDIVAPSLSGVALSGATAASLAWSVTTDEGGGTLYRDILTTATPLSVSAIKAQGDTTTVVSAGTYSGTYTGLTTSTTYYLHAMHEDAAGNPSAVTVSAGVATLAADVTAPTLSSPTGAAVGSGGYSGSVSTNEAGGTLYHVVTTSATKPSAAQVKLGQDNTGTAGAANGSAAVTATGSQAVSGGGLTPGTTYRLWYMHEDASGNQSTVTDAASFTTAAASAAKPEGFDVIAAETGGDGNWTFVPNIVAADYAAPTHNKTANTSNIATVLSGAVAGDVIRLDAGSYGTALNALSGQSFASEVIVCATTYGGATASGISLGSGTQNVTIMGVDFGSSAVTLSSTTDCALKWCKARYGNITGNTRPEVDRCIFDLAWPTYAGGNPAGTLWTQNCLNWTFNTDGIGTRILMMRGIVFGLYLRADTGSTFSECLVWGIGTTNADETSFRAWRVANGFANDGVHSDAHYAAVEDTNSGTSYTNCAFIPGYITGRKGAQGFDWKGGTNVNITASDIMAFSSVNSLAMQVRGTNFNLSNLSLHDASAQIQWFTNSATNRVADSFAWSLSTNAPLTVLTGNQLYPFGSGGAFVGAGSPNTVTNWVVNTGGGYDASKGASGLLATILARKAAYEATL